MKLIKNIILILVGLQFNFAEVQLSFSNYDEAALTGGATNTGGLTTLTDKIPDVLKPSTLGFALNLAKPGLGVLYNFIQAKRQEQQVQDLIDQQIESLETTGSTYNQRTGETVSNVTPEVTEPLADKSM